MLALWQLADRGQCGFISPARFPTPAEVGAALQQIVVEGYSNARLHEHVLRSVLLVTMGFVVASSIGVALGLAMGASRTVEAFVNPIFLMLRPIPPLAWIPLAIVWLGLGDAAKMMVIFVRRLRAVGDQQLHRRAPDRQADLRGRGDARRHAAGATGARC